MPFDLEIFSFGLSELVDVTKIRIVNFHNDVYFLLRSSLGETKRYLVLRDVC